MEYRERKQVTETIMTGEQIYSYGYMGNPVFIGGKQQKYWMLEKEFRYSKRQWNVQIDEVEGLRLNHINVTSSVYPN